MYRKGNPKIWKGRKSQNSLREVWHQAINAVDLNREQVNDSCLLGFCSDVGVKRNLGRPGAVAGPSAIRKALVNFAIHFVGDFNLFDGGDVLIEGDHLEKAQDELGTYVGKLLVNDTFPILLGGGHEITYGHTKGVMDAFPDKKVGVINFDPHFDLREYPQGTHSGSWGRQLFDVYSDRFHYLPIGIDKAVNIASMFHLMKEWKQNWISLEELLGEPNENLSTKIECFAKKVDIIVITLDLDIFSSGIAPGVSAPNPYGVLPQNIKPLFNAIFKSGKVVSFDVAEMNPKYDNGKTAKLAAHFIYDVVMNIANRSSR